MNKRIRPEIINRLLAISAGFLLGAAMPGTASACSANLDRTQIEAADGYLDQNRPVDAFRVMYPLSQNGSGGAHHFLSKMYEEGRGLKKSPFMVRHLNWMGSQYGDPESMFRAAQDFYAKGHKKDGDYLAGKAVECGHKGALVLLLKKRIEDGSKDEALKLLERAIEQSIPEAKFILAEQYDKGGLGLAKDPRAAFNWYYLAAKDGVPKSMAAVAYAFTRGDHGHGVPDDRAAIHWYFMAAKAGHVESITAYAWMLANGRGAQKDVDEAIYYLKKASKLGDANADQFLLEFGGKATANKTAKG
ncbi:sel1 repeat family protein [Acidovorax sp. LjRoot129]|uniref:tetratricopeptide repeat protein n=1 Tax=unclassified Acidovorax TaxID=2684926 RepID=UPI003ECCB379